MGFGAEIKDFVSGFSTGWKLVEDAEENKAKRESRKLDDEYRGLRNQKMKQDIDDVAGERSAFRNAAGGAGDPSAGPNATAEGFDPATGEAKASTGSFNEAGKLPLFASVAPRLVNDLSKDFGLKGWQAEGLVGSLAHESGGFGNMQEDKPMIPGSRGGYGYAQWTGPRRRQFEAWAKEQGLDINSYEANYGFLKHELQNTPEGKVLAGLRQAPDAITSARLFTDGFLRPGIPHMDSRYKWTNRVASIRKGDPSHVQTAASPAAPSMTAGASPALPIQPANAETANFGGQDKVAQVLANPSAYAPAVVEWAKKQQGGASVQTASYAEGGLVEDDEEILGEELPQQVSAVPLNLTGDSAETPDAVRRNPASGQSPAAPREIRQSDLLSLDAIPEAIDGGLKYIQKAFGFDQPRPAIGAVNPRVQQANEAFANNAGAAEPEEMQAIDKAVDPSGKLSDDQRHIAGFNAVYKYWMDKGDPVKAQKAVAGMLMAQRRAVSMDGTMARAAYENGDIQGMVDAVVNGKNRIPDGESVRATKITPQGVEFEIVDNNGKVKQKSKASIEDVVNLANQMQSGKAWFDQIVQVKALSPSQKLAEEKAAREGREGEARGRLESSLIGNEREFVSTLTPEQLADYNAMSRADKNDFRLAHQKKLQAEAVQKRTDDAAATAAEKEEWKRQFAIFKESVTHGRWEADRERLLDTAEKRLIQEQLEEEGRNNRHGQSQEWRRARQLELDQMALEKRKGASVQAGLGKTAGERKDRALDIDAETRQADVWNSDTGVALNPQTGQNEPVQGPTLDQYNQSGAVQAGAAYGKATNDRKLSPPTQEEYEAINGEVDNLWNAAKDQPGFQALDGNKRAMITGIASDISRANGLDGPRAARVALAMTSPKVQPQVLPDGRVRVSPSLPAVLLSDDAMLQLAMIRGRQGVPTNVTSGGNQGNNPNPPAGDARGGQGAIPGITGNPRTKLEADIQRDQAIQQAADDKRNAERRDKQTVADRAEIARLRPQLEASGDWVPEMENDLALARKALRDRQLYEETTGASAIPLPGARMPAYDFKRSIRK